MSCDGYKSACGSEDRRKSLRAYTLEPGLDMEFRRKDRTSGADGEQNAFEVHRYHLDVNRACK